MVDRLLRMHGVNAATGISRSKVYALMKVGDFPLPREIEGRSLWRESEVQAWIARRWQSAPVVGSLEGRQNAERQRAA
jgi:prophage regulatory protein